MWGHTCACMFLGEKKPSRLRERKTVSEVQNSLSDVYLNWTHSPQLYFPTLSSSVSLDKYNSTPPPPPPTGKLPCVFV